MVDAKMNIRPTKNADRSTDTFYGGSPIRRPPRGETATSYCVNLRSGMNVELSDACPADPEEAASARALSRRQRRSLADRADRKYQSHGRALPRQHTGRVTRNRRTCVNAAKLVLRCGSRRTGLCRRSEACREG